MATKLSSTSHLEGDTRWKFTRAYLLLGFASRLVDWVLVLLGLPSVLLLVLFRRLNRQIMTVITGSNTLERHVGLVVARCTFKGRFCAMRFISKISQVDGHSSRSLRLTLLAGMGWPRLRFNAAIPAPPLALIVVLTANITNNTIWHGDQKLFLCNGRMYLILSDKINQLRL